MRHFILIAFVLLAACAAHQHANETNQTRTHKCKHDTLPKPEILHINTTETDTVRSTVEDLNLAAGVPTPPPKGGFEFRFVMDYSMLQTTTPRQKYYIEKVLMPSTVDFFKKALRVRVPTRGPIKVDKSGLDICDGLPTTLIKGVTADLVVAVKAYDDKDDGAVAFASSCYFDPQTDRPVVGRIHFNLAMLEIDYKDPLTHAYNLYTAVHELTHVLGFSAGLYEQFRGPDGITKLKRAFKTTVRNGKKFSVVDVEPLTSKLREHFDCPSIPGAYIENDGSAGSAGSHFEKDIFLEEHMTSNSGYDSRQSEFSLALLEGTGWYLADYNYADHFVSGFGKGCPYYNGFCNTNKGPIFDEFCAGEDARRCSPTYMGGAICIQDSFAPECFLADPRMNLDCTNPAAAKGAVNLPELQSFGPDANTRCFAGTLELPKFQEAKATLSYCFKYECGGSGKNTYVDVKLGTTTHRCLKKGKTAVKGFNGVLDCPEPAQFCKAVLFDFCRFNCFGRGTCQNGKCVCDKGFTGRDCGIPSDIPANMR
jgi:hypothetical protein